ncbi:MAG: methyltransferase family protein [Terriglobia bacterium]
MRDSYGAWAARWRVPLGFAFAIAFAVLSQPRQTLLAAGSLVALAGLVLRAVAAGYIEKNKTLATGGPFRYTRNPLYLGSFILGAGFMIAGASWILVIAFVLLFPLVYFPVMRREEVFLRGRFGEAFDAYAAQAPLWLPIPGRRAAGNGVFRWRQYLKNREYEAAAGWLAIFIFLTVKWMLR